LPRAAKEDGPAEEAKNPRGIATDGCRSKSFAVRCLFDRHAGWFVGSVYLEVFDGLQGFAVRTIVQMVETRQPKKQAFEPVEFPEEYPVWHWALAHIP
jgi:hypothetical protein